MAVHGITLTTDFGEESPYVAAMKGAILTVNPQARIVDLGHQIPPQDVRYAAFFIAAALPYFPSETLHVVVVDPGVGTERALLYAEVNRQRLLAPDNGCWTSLITEESLRPRVIRLTEPRFWRSQVSDTFHGRDILAPVAGHLSLGVDPAELGQPVDNWVELERPAVHAGKLSVQGEVIFVDHFGNVITNIRAEHLGTAKKPEVKIQIGKQSKSSVRRVRTYGEAEPGELIALISSTGNLELAVSQGNAAKRLHVGVGTRIKVGWEASVGRNA